MPELPEVETVRRGLAPVMEGAKFTKVEARRGDLRWPLPKDFVARLEGRTVEGLGRRAKYLLADLSSGDVLLMHLGMSGSFRVAREAGGKAKGDATPGAYYHDRSKDLGARPRGVSHVVGRAHFLQRSAPVRLDEDRSARQARSGAAVARARPRAARQRLRRRDAGEGLPGQEDLAQGRAVSTRRSWLGSAISMSARRCTARGSRQAASGLDVGAALGRAARACRPSGRRDPRRAGRCDQGRRLVIARSPPDLGRAWAVPAQFPRL